MNSFIVAFALLATIAITEADRQDALQIVQQLKEVQPRYKEIQDYVISVVADARLQSSNKIHNFHQDLFLVKETFLQQTIIHETNVLYQVGSQAPSVDKLCLEFLTTSTEANMNLAGISYTNCIISTNDVLTKEVRNFYSRMNLDESQYAGVGILEVFRGENVFYDPQAILAKLEATLANMEDYPTYIASEIVDSVSSFAVILENIRTTYIGCMTNSEQLLRTTLDTVLLQLQTVCNGQINDKSTSTTVTPGHTTTTIASTTITPSPPPTVGTAPPTTAP